MEEPLKFLKRQKLLVIASHDAKDVWVTNVYFVADEKATLYFVSSEKVRHSQMFLKNPNVSFSVAWYDSTDHTNRKAIQGLGVCRPAKNIVEMTKGIKLLHRNFPKLRKYFTLKWIMNNLSSSRVWVVKPTYLKYWDDELYGNDESKEFNLK